MEFVITNKAKNKARNLRIRKEKKWIPFRLVYIISFIVFIVSFSYGTFIVTTSDYILFDRCAITASITGMTAVLARAFTMSFTQHWIHQRQNEKLSIENQSLNHFFQVSWGTGWNTGRIDNTGYLFAYNLDSIKSISFDNKTKRIEFFTAGRGYHYKNIYTGEIDRQWEIREVHKCIVYDYYSPSLIEILAERGIPIVYEELNQFRILDNKI